MTYIVDDIGTVVAAMRQGEEEFPYYMYGHRLEISNRLILKDKDKEQKNKKYPLVGLRMDVSEFCEGDMIHYKMNLAILTFTLHNYNAEQRYTNVFKPILQPLYERFLVALRTTHIFTWPAEYRNPKHIKIDRPFFGIPESERNVKHVFNDPVDAIEILNLEISKRIKNC